MTDRQKYIKKLLTTFHLDMSERKMFIDTPINIIEINEIIREFLESNIIFPESATIWSDGQEVFEGHFIEKLDKSRYKLHYQRHQAINIFQLAERQEEIFDDFDKLVDNFINREFDYQIDGLVIKNK